MTSAFVGVVSNKTGMWGGIHVCSSPSWEKGRLRIGVNAAWRGLTPTTLRWSTLSTASGKEGNFGFAVVHLVARMPRGEVSPRLRFAGRPSLPQVVKRVASALRLCNGVIAAR